MREVRLTESDRTVFAGCPKCNVSGNGMKAAKYYSMAYSRKQWARGPQCDNCGTDMQFKYEVKVDD